MKALASEVRDYWRGVWSDRVVGSTPQQAAGRSDYGKQETEAVSEDAAKALDLCRHDTLLDVGCSKRLIGSRLAPKVRKYVGLDYVLGFRPDVVGDAAAIPFRDASFDKALCAGVLLCIHPDLHGRVLSELRRVVKPGGIAFVASNPRSYDYPDNHASLVACFEEETLMILAGKNGWESARLRPISTVLPQHRSYFDMVLQ